MTKRQAESQKQPAPPLTHVEGIADTSIKNSGHTDLNAMTSDPLLPLPTATDYSDVRPLDQSSTLRLLLANRIMLQGYITAITGDRTLSEDVFQEVSMVVMEKFATVTNAESFRPWVRSIARLQSLKAVNQRQAYNAFLSSDTIDQLDKAWDERERENPRTSTKTALEKCVAKLTPKARELVQLRYRQNLSGQEIADHLGKPLNTIYVAISRIHRALSDCIRTKLTQMGTNHVD
jgi:RNA polymerase sigma-70 factor, ECF subfamily